MDISQSKLFKDPKYQDIAIELNTLVEEGRGLGASEGPQRIELICEEYKHLSPNSAYLWINPGAFQHEIEEAQLHSQAIERAYFWRNIFSLAPLIATWTALLWAVFAYQQYVLRPGSDRGASFLALWQTGFQGRDPLNFTFAAALDVIFLVAYLIFIIYVNTKEKEAYQKASVYIRNLQGAIDKLSACIAEVGITHISDQSDIDRVVHAVQDVIDDATKAVKQNLNDANVFLKQYVDQTMRANNTALSNLEQSVKGVIAGAEASVKQSHQTLETLMTQTAIPMMTSFHQDMSSLHGELQNYQGRLNDLTTASQQLAGSSQGLAQASQALVNNAAQYTVIGQDIGSQINALNTTQQEVLTQIQAVAGGIMTASGNMNTATTNMINATQSVGNIADQLTRDTRQNMQDVSHNLETATNGLAHIGPDLEQAAQDLEHASRQLAAIDLPWFFKRRTTRQKASTRSGGSRA